MRVNFFPTIEQVDRDALHGSVVLVIDVLRSSSSIIAALENGAKRVIPVADIETATRLVKEEDRPEKVLAGERKGERIEGFDLGNSPLEFKAETVGNKTVVMCTSNGTRALSTIPRAKGVLVCAINNVSSVVEKVVNEDSVSIICCGDEGNLSAEDLLCGGMVLNGLRGSVDENFLNDSARLSLFIADNFRDKAEEFLLGSDRGRALVEKGFERDVVHCARADISSMVPVLSDGSITPAD